MKKKVVLFSLFSFLLSVAVAFASGGDNHTLGLTGSVWGFLAVTIFVVAYIFVMTEEFSHLRKSKPVVSAAVLIWVIVAYLVHKTGGSYEAMHKALEHNIIEYAELLLFLMVAMTYINAMIERNVFESLRSWLVFKGFTYRSLFWITGIISFFLSPIADNLTTALLMGTVVMAVGSGNPKFVSASFINIVVAANAGGAFSPFGDITTLMVWQAGKAEFFDFFRLFVPSVINYVIPAIIISFTIPKNVPPSKGALKIVPMKRGATIICILFFCTIATAVSLKQFFHLPPFMGMMLGLGYLFLFTFYLKKTFLGTNNTKPFNIFDRIGEAEWDTLLFFFGVIFCVGGLGYIGYLDIGSQFLYVELGPTIANIVAGFLSAIVDNIPVMFAILSMSPDMALDQWLLVTLTAGVGGSMLSIGSAAGVALMGQSKGQYTFFSHLKWAPAITLGYAASIWVHLLINH